MRTSSPIPGILLLALLVAACGESPTVEDDTHEIRPDFRVGDRYRVREERTVRDGRGRFPPAADLPARTQGLNEETHLFEEEIVEADDLRVFRVRRTYLTSVRDGRPTAVAGKTYEIVHPYPVSGAGDLGARAEGADGGFVPATDEELKEIVGGAIRLAATLLPDRPVSKGATWEASRILSTLDIDPPSRLARLESIDPGRTARVVWQPYGRLAVPGESRVSLRETLVVDLAGGRIGGYRSRTEVQQETPATQWKQIEIEVSVVSIE
jgi:hypothetical protein